MANILNVHSNLVIYADGAVTFNPQRRYADWTRHVQGVSVDRVEIKEYTVPAGASAFSLFNYTRGLSSPADTEYKLVLSTRYPSIYRLSWVSHTLPTWVTPVPFGTDLAGKNATVAVKTNSTINLSIAGVDLSQYGVVVGTTIFVPGLSTGDVASPFNIANEGKWSVLAVASDKLTLCRPDGVPFQAASETVALTTGYEVKGWTSVAGTSAEVGDTLSLASVNLSGQVQGLFFKVTEVGGDFIEFSSPEPLPEYDSVTNLTYTFFSRCARYIRIESDRPVETLLNGNAGGSGERLYPIAEGIEDQRAWREQWGRAFRLSITNLSKTYPANVLVITAE